MRELAEGLGQMPWDYANGNNMRALIRGLKRDVMGIR